MIRPAHAGASCRPRRERVRLPLQGPTLPRLASRACACRPISRCDGLLNRCTSPTVASPADGPITKPGASRSETRPACFLRACIRQTSSPGSCRSAARTPGFAPIPPHGAARHAGLDGVPGPRLRCGNRPAAGFKHAPARRLFTRQGCGMLVPAHSERNRGISIAPTKNVRPFARLPHAGGFGHSGGRMSTGQT